METGDRTRKKVEEIFGKLKKNYYLCSSEKKHKYFKHMSMNYKKSAETSGMQASAQEKKGLRILSMMQKSEFRFWQKVADLQMSVRKQQDINKWLRSLEGAIHSFNELPLDIYETIKAGLETRNWDMVKEGILKGLDIMGYSEAVGYEMISKKDLSKMFK